VPHEPQFLGSLWVSMHALPQWLWPGGHAHVALMQLDPAPHEFPHVPQFDESFAVLTHEPEQSFSPTGHCVHCPSLHA
jgi:hypothetical protein